jgi:NitT/TauT family transport system ATP-binding protein
VDSGGSAAKFFAGRRRQIYRQGSEEEEVPMTDIVLYNVTVNYGGAAVLDEFSCTFGSGVNVILGKSGVGKTTLLKAIAGLLPHVGEVTRGKVSYVFQESRLVDNVTVRGNLELVLRGVMVDAAERQKAIDEYLEIAEISHLAAKYPHQLSGGEAQRVSLVRGFIYPSAVLLLDEPFQSLDVGVKRRLMDVFARLNKNSRRTVLYVTHDIDEALKVADNVYILRSTLAEIQHIAEIPDPYDRRDIISDYTALKKQLIQLLD